MVPVTHSYSRVVPGSPAECPSRIDPRLRVAADDLDGALADLLDTRNQMTRAVLGFHERDPGS